MTPRIAAAAILVLGFLVVVSLGPFPQPDLPGPLEQLPHAIAYAVATYVLLAAMDRGGHLRRRPGRIALLAASMLALGALLELGQRVVDRDVELVDIVADAVGVVAAVLAWVLVRWLRNVGGAR